MRRNPLPSAAPSDAVFWVLADADDQGGASRFDDIVTVYSNKSYIIKNRFITEEGFAKMLNQT